MCIHYLKATLAPRHAPLPLMLYNLYPKGNHLLSGLSAGRGVAALRREFRLLFYNKFLLFECWYHFCHYYLLGGATSRDLEEAVAGGACGCIVFPVLDRVFVMPEMDSSSIEDKNEPVSQNPRNRLSTS
jgi:hypothetical protein